LTRAVFDPNVLVAALISPDGTPAECLRQHAEGRFELVVSERLVTELSSVLERDKVRSYVTTEAAHDWIDSLRREALVVEDPTTIQRESADPGDDYLIALARASQAHVLVSGDPHLTSLSLSDVLTLTPRDFLERLP
jgi:putative PIN family toxin of toxin-antitoxin system